MIYVDSPTYYGYTTLRYKVWSHLWSDTSIDELHEFADRLGLKRSWFQLKVGPTATEEAKLRRAHYDVVPTVRVKAIKLGAIPMELSDFLEAHPLRLPQIDAALMSPEAGRKGE